MPKLPTYTAPGFEAPISGGRRATAEDFSTAVSGAGEAAAGMIGAGRAIQDAAKAHLAEIEDREARTALVQSTEIRARYARELDAAVLSGADLDKIKDKMRDDLTKVGADFQTQRGADQLQLYTANSEIMYDEQANRIKVQRASATAKLDAQKFLVESSKLVQANPAYLAVASQNAEAFADTLRGIPPEKRAEIVDGLRKDLNMAAAVAAARLDPNGTKAKLEAGEWDLTPSQRETAIQRADATLAARRASEAHERSIADHDRKLKDDAAEDRITKAILGGKMGARQTERLIMDDPDLQPQTRRTLVSFLEHRAKLAASGENAGSKALMMDMYFKINAPDDDPNKIRTIAPVEELARAGKLNLSQADFLVRQVQGQRDVNGRTLNQKLQGELVKLRYRMSSDPLWKHQPELSAAVQSEILAGAEEEIGRRRDKGEPMAPLFDPRSKEYLFAPERIKATADAVRSRRDDDLRSRSTRVTNDAELLAVPVNGWYVGDDGVPRQKTKEVAAKIEAEMKARRAAAAPSVTSDLFYPLFKVADDVLAGRSPFMPTRPTEATRKYWTSHDKAALERWDATYTQMDLLLKKDRLSKDDLDRLRAYRDSLLKLVEAPK